ncbi:MAG: DUF433 domain-containing protein [Candidatus Wildermuthbacteria bacterium]|nr:DUF433 domain-containing protein [Candidatus Wildermuthbacteria bacterium]
MKEIAPQVTTDEKTQFGKPVIAGTRVPVEVVIGHIATGDAIETVMKEYGLTREQVLAALKYAAKLVGEEMLIAK